MPKFSLYTLCLAILALLTLSQCTALEGIVQADSEVKYDSAMFAPNSANRNTSRERFVSATALPENTRGRYEANIEGLDLNPSTGVINLDRSEAGILYTITFTPDGMELKPSKTKILIAGIDYLDSIYPLSRNQIRAFPIWNAERNYARSRAVPGLPRNTSARFSSSHGFQTTLGSLVDSASGIINLQRAKDVILFRRRSVDNFTNPLNLSISYLVRDSLNVRADTTRTGGTGGGTGGGTTGGGTGGTGGTGGGTTGGGTGGTGGTGGGTTGGGTGGTGGTGGGTTGGGTGGTGGTGGGTTGGGTGGTGGTGGGTTGGGTSGTATSAVRPLTVRNTVGIQIYHFPVRSDIPAFLLDAVRQRKKFPIGRSEGTVAERPIIIIILDRE